MFKQVALVVSIALCVFLVPGCGKDEEAPELTPVAEPEVSEIDNQAADTTAAEAIDDEPSSRELVAVEDGNGRYTLQVSAWRTRSKAERQAQALQGAGYDAYVQRAKVGSSGEVWYRVRVGRYATLTQARQAAEGLKGVMETGFWLDNYR